MNVFKIITAGAVLAFVGFLFIANGVYGNGESLRKIVVFKEGALNSAAEDELIKHVGATKIKNLDLIGAKVVLLPNRASEKALKLNAAVLRIDDDVIVEALAKGSSGPVQPAETLPWGINRIDAELAWPTTVGSGIKVGIIDTGIDLKHPDLAANIKGGYNAINSRRSPNDDNGHGTHVAGIISAIDNDIGVIGVSPKANLYAIKVLAANGSGYLSDVIEGIQWAMTNGMRVINLSLGTSSDVESFHQAIIAAKNAGTVVVAAAGNAYGGAVLYPAAYQETIAVSATDSNDNAANFSSAGPEVDLAAPGANIFSTYKGSSYATLSGTSMAAPHVTGAAALVLTRPVGIYDANGDGLWGPDEVQIKLQSVVQDLGAQGFDPIFGWGLVNAFHAIQ